MPEHTEHEHHGMKGKHRVTMAIGHAHIFGGERSDESKVVVAPTWGLSYDYWLSNQWAVGLQTELIVESFIVKHNNEEEVEREYPIALVPVGLFKPLEHLTILAGVGAEFAASETIMMTRLGVEVGWEVPGDWEVGFEMLWDGKWNFYDSWGISFTASKILGGK